MSNHNSYRRYVLFTLMTVYAFNFIDRQLLVILQESIKKELMLSDTQLGLLTGLTFAMFYVTLGIPIARFADTSNRKNIIAVSLTLWSALTAFTGFATNFIQLVLARIGVGIGEAGCSPQSHAIISDYYPLEKRATALSIYSMGIYIGIFIGFLGGGFLNQYYGWRVAFFAMGTPGVLLALLLYFTVKEPLRGASDTHQIKNDAQSFGQVISFIFSKKSFVYLSLGSGFITFVVYGLGNWLASFFSRYHGMSSQNIGITNALIIGIGGGLGTFLGGYLGDHFGKVSKKWYLWIPAIAGIISLPFSLTAIFSLQKELVFACFTLATILNAIYLAPAIAMAHHLVPPQMRALTSAVLFFCLNLIGLGGGPLVVGILSDSLAPSVSALSLQYAMACIVFVGLIGSFFFFLGGKNLAKDLEGK